LGLAALEFLQRGTAQHGITVLTQPLLVVRLLLLQEGAAVLVEILRVQMAALVAVAMVVIPLAVAQGHLDKVMLEQRVLFKEAALEAAEVVAQVLRLFPAQVRVALDLVVIQAQERFLL